MQTDIFQTWFLVLHFAAKNVHISKAWKKVLKGFGFAFLLKICNAGVRQFA